MVGSSGSDSYKRGDDSSLQNQIFTDQILFFTLLHQICRRKASQTNLLNERHVQLVIPVPADHTSVKSHTAPVVVSHTNVSPLSHAALRDPDLIEDLKPFAIRYGLKFHETFQTGLLLYYFLYYQITYQPKKAANTRITTAIKILETAWYMDIGSWSRQISLSPEDVITGEVVSSHCLASFVKLILHPLQTRQACIYFDEKGDISGKRDGVGIWRLCRFHFYQLNLAEKTLELNFKVNDQTKGRILQLNDIKKFDDFGIYFQHPVFPGRLLFNPFSCKEFDEPRPGSEQRRIELDSEIQKSYPVLVREEPTTKCMEVRFDNNHPSGSFSHLLDGFDSCVL